MNKIMRIGMYVLTILAFAMLIITSSCYSMLFPIKYLGAMCEFLLFIPLWTLYFLAALMVNPIIWLGIIIYCITMCKNGHCCKKND